ncbi:EF-hand and coiled-coil domain-containing protein 1, partial [Lamprotornis superbus]
VEEISWETSGTVWRGVHHPQVLLAPEPWGTTTRRSQISISLIREVRKSKGSVEDAPARGSTTIVKGPLLGELQQKVEETEMLKMELQMLETERIWLSLVEEKLMDVLQLLQQLRALNISKPALGKILLSTLESCRDPQPGKAQLLEVLDTLQQELTACELLHKQPLEQAQSPQSLSNPLVRMELLAVLGCALLLP